MPLAPKRPSTILGDASPWPPTSQDEFDRIQKEAADILKKRKQKKLLDELDDMDSLPTPRAGRE
jgi:hypothetical protein